MYTIQPKKMMLINILEILKKYTDSEHTLTQKEILDLLEKEYCMKAERKAIKRNLMNLIDFGYNIGYSEVTRIGKSGQEEIIYTDWYLERDFTDAELRLLIDSILFSKRIPYRQCKDLIEKIENLSNKFFTSKMKHVCNIPEDMPANKQLFFNIEMIDDAIGEKKKVSFKYNDFNTEYKLTPRLDADGNVREYIVNPYQMVATNGRYYLICNYDKYDNVANYRVDRISDIKILDERVKPMKEVAELRNGLNLSRHMAEHIYMFGGESQIVEFITYQYMVGEVIDWFGKGIDFTKMDDNVVRCKVKVNLHAMRYWAMQYINDVTVVSPKSLVEEIKKEVEEGLRKYGEQL